MRLSGMGDAEVQEAAGAAAQVVGFSTYLHGVEYSVEQFKQELDAAVAYITSHAAAVLALRARRTRIGSRSGARGPRAPFLPTPSREGRRVD